MQTFLSHKLSEPAAYGFFKRQISFILNVHCGTVFALLDE